MKKDLDMLDGYEYRIINNLPKSEADKLVDKKLLNSTVKQVFETEIKTSVDGKSVNAPIGVLLVTKKVAYDLEHPEKIDLSAYSKVLGENKIEQEVSFKGADELFGDIVIKKNDE